MKRICAAIAFAVPVFAASTSGAVVVSYSAMSEEVNQFSPDSTGFVEIPLNGQMVQVATTQRALNSACVTGFDFPALGLQNYCGLLVELLTVPVPSLPPIVLKPEPPLFVPPKPDLPPMDNDPKPDLPTVVDDPIPETPVVTDDKKPEEPPVVEVAELAEPGTLGILGFALAGMGMFGYRRKAA